MDVRRKRRLASDINVVPYIDVMLVLVVIFMATATIALGVQVDLPEAPAQPLDTTEQEEPIQLTVRRDGALLLNLGEAPEQPVSAEEVKRIVSIALRHKPQRRVVVSGDRSADYGMIMNAMVLLQEAGAQKVGLQSRPPER
ncbi:MAG TPA: ExbD/TolR family protein [Nevskiales bacterium]|nr:ExbD/TolR family protein [Nevskiales bacterium]